MYFLRGLPVISRDERDFFNEVNIGFKTLAV